jgi:hypothetical protein
MLNYCTYEICLFINSYKQLIINKSLPSFKTCFCVSDIMWYDMIYIYIYIYLTATGLTPDGSSTAHIYTQTIHRKKRTEHT